MPSPFTFAPLGTDAEVEAFADVDDPAVVPLLNIPLPLSLNPPKLIFRILLLPNKPLPPVLVPVVPLLLPLAL